MSTTEDLDLAKAFRAELNKHRADSYIFTPAKTKIKDTITVDFKDVPALEKALSDPNSMVRADAVLALKALTGKKYSEKPHL